MEDREDEVLRLTSRIVRDHCARRIGRVRELLADDVVWIGPLEFQWAESKEGMDSILDLRRLKWKVNIREEKYRTVMYDKDICLVYGSFVCGMWHIEKPVFHKIRVTFLWKRTKGEWKARHIHMSQPYDYPVPSEMSDEELEDLYGYAGSHGDRTKKWLGDHRGHKKLLIKDCSGYYHYIYENEIYCIESDSHNCNVILKDRKIRVRKKISEYEAELPGFFRRVHRGYLVNENCIEGISLYRLTLPDGLDIPVSRKKYAQIKPLLKKRAGADGNESGNMIYS